MTEPAATAMATATPEITPEREADRAELVRLSKRGAELYAALQQNSHARDEIIVREMAAGAIARELAELTGLSVARIYKLRDNGIARQ